MKNINKFETTERPECSADTKLFFDDVYKSGTRGKKQQVDVLQYGRSMIEMLGVLAIVGVLSVGGIAGYSKAMQKFKINKTIDDISHIVTNIRTLYAQQTTYRGLNNESAIKMGVMPSHITSTTVRTNGYAGMWVSPNSFGGEFTIYAPSDTDVFSIGYYGLPKEVCVALATYDWGDRYSSGLLGISVASDWVTVASFFERDWYIKDLKPKGCSLGTCIGSIMSVVDAAQACQCTSNNDCGIIWLYQ